jgi:hypothetical protein
MLPEVRRIQAATRAVRRGWRFVCGLGVVVATAGSGLAGDRPLPFTEEAALRGLVYPMMPAPQWQGRDGFGCGFADLDGDGDPDAILLGRADGLVGVFENQGGLFVDRSATSGITPGVVSVAFAAADYDGDGDVDLFLTRHEWPNALYRNDGGFQFTEVTAKSGIEYHDDRHARCAVWGDFDGDGWLDLFVANYVRSDGSFVPDELYRNRGDGSFEEVAAARGVLSLGLTYAAAWTDVDRDGDLDLALAQDRGQLPTVDENRLYRNDGGAFTDVSGALGFQLGLCSMGMACGDIDADGDVDYYVTNSATSSAPPLAGQFPLLLNAAPGPFALGQVAWGIAKPQTVGDGWGACFLDWNNDGRLDLYVNAQVGPNALLTQGEAPPMTDLAAALGVTGSGMWSYATAFADIDGDGDADLLLNDIGTPAKLYINHEGERRHWVELRIRGRWPNRQAIGATVEMQVGTAIRYRELQAGGNSYLAQHEVVLRIGLDDAALADAATVRWPSGGPVRELSGIPGDRRWTIYPPEELGDADRDGDVDLADRAALCAQFGRVEPGSEALDMDGDFELGLADLALQRARDARLGADFDGDGAVGGADLALLLGAWGTKACLPDLDADGTVTATDLSILLSAWSR